MEEGQDHVEQEYYNNEDEDEAQTKGVGRCSAIKSSSGSPKRSPC